MQLRPCSGFKRAYPTLTQPALRAQEASVRALRKKRMEGDPNKVDELDRASRELAQVPHPSPPRIGLPAGHRPCMCLLKGGRESMPGSSPTSSCTIPQSAVLTVSSDAQGPNLTLTLPDRRRTASSTSCRSWA